MMSYVREQDDYWTSIDDTAPLKQQEKCYAIAFSKDGTIMVSGCQNYVKVWSCSNGGDLKYNKATFVLKAHSKDVNTLYFSKKSNMFLSGSDDKSIKMWLQANNSFTCKQDLVGHQHWVIQVIMNDAENTIFSADWGGNLIIWSFANEKWQISQTQKLHNEQIHSICLNDQQNCLATLGWDKKISILYSNNQWKFNPADQIPLENQGFRIGFMSDNQLVLQPKQISTTQIYQLNQGTGKFEKKVKGIDLTKAEDDVSYFPVQFLKAQQLLIVKHNKHINLIKKINADNFVLQKCILLEEERTFGQVNEAFNLLVTWDCQKHTYKVQKL